MTIELPKLTTYQRSVYDFLTNDQGNIDLNSGKIATIKSVRQSGKSFLCQMLLISVSFSKSNTVSAIYEPTLGQARVQFKAIEQYFKGSNLIATANASLLEITFVNGSTIYFKSTEQSSRGYTIDGILILDECAYLREDEIYSILPLASAKNALMVIASTPFISDGYFYTMYSKGINSKSDKIKSFDWSKEEEISQFLTDERKDFYKQTMSRSKYITEVLGEFLTDDGMLFRNIEGCTSDEPIPLGQRLWLAVDWGTGSENDYTELVGVNEDGKVPVLHSTNNLSPMEQITWLANIINDLSTKCQIAKLTCEQNSIGKVYIDAIQRKIKNIRITEFITTNKSKQDIVTTLQLALENGDITIPREQDLLNQLRGYEAQINPRTKTITYNGKSGTHDDKVMALMMAYHSFKGRLGTYNVSFK